MTRRQIPPEDLDRFRAAAAEKVRTTALNALAAELRRNEYPGDRSFGGDGMSPAALKRFLSGWADPARAAAAPSARDTTASEQRGGEALILGALVRDLRPERRHGALLTLLGTIASVHRQNGLPLPSWFAGAALTTCSDELRGHTECQVPQVGARGTIGE